MWRGLPGAAAEDKVVGSERAPRHVRRPAEGEGGPASEAVKQMATEMHRRWPRFTHAPSPPLSPSILCSPPLSLHLLSPSILCSPHLSLFSFLSMLESASSPARTSDFSSLDICIFIFFFSVLLLFFLSLSLSLPD